jgi:hypothetical protein
VLVEPDEHAKGAAMLVFVGEMDEKV